MLVLTNAPTHAQLVPIKAIADSGVAASFGIDKSGNIHLVWQGNGAIYQKFDSLWNPLSADYAAA
jgi:hypothetical protein